MSIGDITLRGRHGRKYLNAAELNLFIGAANELPARDRLFCLVMVWTGCRISEALSLSARSFEPDEGPVATVTLKHRQPEVKVRADACSFSS